MQRLLLETFEGLNLTDRQRKIFDDVNVENVVVSKENKLIEIYLVSSHVVAYREICLLEYALGVFFGNADIDIKVHDRFELSQQYNAKVFFDEYKDSLLQIFKAENILEFDMLYQGYAEQRRAYLQKHKRVSEYDSENLMYSVIQEVLSEEAFSSIGCAVHVSLATLVKNYEPLTEGERQYARNPLTHVDFLLFNQMDKQPVLAIEVDGTGFHEAGSKQAERDMKKNSILEKCGVPLLRLRTDGSGEKEKIKNALKGE